MKTTMTPSETLASLRWACRRGMLELDLMLGRFLDRHYESLSPEGLELFKGLLDSTDTELYAWFMDLSIPPEPWQPLITQIRG